MHFQGYRDDSLSCLDDYFNCLDDSFSCLDDYFSCLDDYFSCLHDYKALKMKMLQKSWSAHTSVAICIWHRWCWCALIGRVPRTPKQGM